MCTKYVHCLKKDKELLKSTFRKWTVCLKNGQKVWTDASSNKIEYRQISIRNDAANYMSQEMQIKTAKCFYIPIRMAEIQSTNKTECQWGPEALFTAGGNAVFGEKSYTAILKDSWIVSYKTKPVLTMLSSNWILTYYPVEFLGIYPNEWKTCLHKNLNMHFIEVYSKLPKLKATKISFNRWVDEQLIHSDTRILTQQKRNEL